MEDRKNAEIEAKNAELSELQKSMKEMADSQKKFFDSYSYQPPQTEEEKKRQEATNLIKEMGFATPEDVQRIVAEVEQKYQAKEVQKEADHQLESELSELEKKYSGDDESPKFTRLEVLEYMKKEKIDNPENAFKMLNFDALMEHSIKKAIKTNQGVKTEASDGTGGTTQSTNAELVTAIGKGGDQARAAKDLFFKRLAG